MTAPLLSVVVPTVDEADTLPALLDDLQELARRIPTEVVVVDGGSTDDTADIARQRGADVVSAPLGRGGQLRAGAHQARGIWLFFVHADSHLDPAACAEIEAFLARATTRDFAHLRLRFDGGGFFLRAMEIGQRLRERLFGLVYGDQGLLVSRALYDEVGGYPEWPILEDVGIVDRLAGAGRRVPLDAEIRTSPRRYLDEGPVRAWLRNLRLITRFRLGTPAELLKDRYRPHRTSPGRGAPDGHGRGDGARDGDGPDDGARGSGGTDAAAEHAVVVFLKEPVAGRVKTRLAADIGDEAALRVYRALAEETVGALRGGPWSVELHVDPPAPESLANVRAWLGHGLEVRPQRQGDLGVRMAGALEECLERFGRVCIVGSDIPGITRDGLLEAFAALEEHDVVYGPASDGGYWLVGVGRGVPPAAREALFRDMEWSTETVLTQSLERAGRAGLSVGLLPEKTDVDTLPDVPPALLAAVSAP